MNAGKQKSNWISIDSLTENIKFYLVFQFIFYLLRNRCYLFTFQLRRIRVTCHWSGSMANRRHAEGR